MLPTRLSSGPPPPGMDLVQDVLLALNMGMALALLDITAWIWTLAR